MSLRRLSADKRWMRRAIALARRGEGLTRPNPPVGAVIVKNGRRIAEGYHRKAGGPHAEVVALQKAGARARGATLYVTLEPCSTWGRTPPCVDAIRAHGLRRVVVGATDPNPRHRGRGIAILRRAGIEVVKGVCAVECAALIEPFRVWVETRRPFVTLKLGQTLDGRIADAGHRSRWITSPAARREVHRLRCRIDAILVGRRTVELDNPSLLPAPARGRTPLRVILDAKGQIPLTHRVFSDAHREQTLVITSTRSRQSYRDTLKDRGIDVVRMSAPRGFFSLERVLLALGRRGVLHVLCEGGGTLAAGLLRDNLVNEVWLFIAPRFLGGAGVPSVAGAGWTLARAPKWRVESVTRRGPDVWLRARPHGDD